jgi:hypothetical protein
MPEHSQVLALTHKATVVQLLTDFLAIGPFLQKSTSLLA